VSGQCHAPESISINLFNAELNPIFHLLALLETLHILHFSGLRVNNPFISLSVSLLRLTLVLRSCIFFFSSNFASTLIFTVFIQFFFILRPHVLLIYSRISNYLCATHRKAQYTVGHITRNYIFWVCKTVHNTTIQINHQLEATIYPVYYLRFMYRSTCFGRPHAHHQELNNCSSSLWFYRGPWW